MKNDPICQSREARPISRCMVLAAVVTVLVVAQVAVPVLVASDSETMPVQYACSGNEPFWNLKIDGTQAQLSRLGETEKGGDGMAGHFRSMDFAGIFSWRGPVSEKTSGDLVVFIARQLCLDTMADAEEGGGAMDFGVGLSLPDGTVLLGCCRAVENIGEQKPPAVDKEKTE